MPIGFLEITRFENGFDHFFDGKGYTICFLDDLVHDVIREGFAIDNLCSHPLNVVLC